MDISGYNENIDVRDESIIKYNEHPKFKIGDVINNGCIDFIVTGFTRSALGLAYVLNNGHKLIGWLTEQVDAKCHLVKRKQSMNNIPYKIYIREVDLVKVGNSLSDNNDKTDVEYIRKDAIIKKAETYLKEQFIKDVSVLASGAIHINFETAINNFINYIKEE